MPNDLDRLGYNLALNPKLGPVAVQGMLYMWLVPLGLDITL